MGALKSASLNLYKQYFSILISYMLPGNFSAEQNEDKLEKQSYYL